MKLVRQKNGYACGVTSLFMLNDNKDYRRIKKFCKRHLDYKPNKNIGITITREKICGQLKMLGFDAYFAPDGNRTVAMHTKYNRAMLL